MSTPKIQPPAPTAAQSERLNNLNSNESSLNKERIDATRRENSWHRAYVWSLVGAAVLGGFSILSQIFERNNILVGKRAGDIIIGIEADRHTIEKQISDLAIAQAQGAASVAASDAGKANKRAGELEREAANQRVRASSLENATEELRKQNHETEVNLLAANRQIESERLKRVKLAVSLLPRHVFDQSGMIAALSSLKPGIVKIVYLDESESTGLAEEIAFVFENLKWQVRGKPSPGNVLAPGLHVGRGLKINDKHDLNSILEYNRSLRRADVLSGLVGAALSKAGAKAKAGFIPAAQGEPLDTLFIEVGEKTNDEADDALRELGEPQVTGPMKVGRNRVTIPPDTPSKP